MASERTRSRGPRRGQGRRTIYWEISDPFGEGDQVQLYVREAGALGWAKNQGSILGSSWEGANGDDFAYTSVSYYDGWLDDARDEYPNVRFRQLEYSPPRSWIQARDQAIRNRRSGSRRDQVSDAARLNRLYRKYVSSRGSVDVDRLYDVIRRETRAAEQGRIRVSRELLRELRADLAFVGRARK